MGNGLKINKLEIENVKRVKAVKMEPAENGLTVIGGRNNQGKTSVLDSIAWALGGDRYRPSKAAREGSVIPPVLHIVMNNGLVVERRGKNSDLKVTDPSGKKGGQTLLNEFVEQLALDLPKFLQASSKEKGEILLRIIGVEEELEQYEREEQDLYHKRHTLGQIADQKRKFAKEMPYYSEAPKEPVSASDLIRQQQEILARNGENQRKRERLNEITINKHRVFDELERLDEQIEGLQKQKTQLLAEYDQTVRDEETARKTVLELKDESTAELEENLLKIEEINRKVRANLDKDKAETDAQDYADQYNRLTAALETVREKKTSLLKDAKLPLPGLSVEGRELTYQGQKWDNLSGSDQLKVATAIVRKLNPKCGFVLLDKLEQMDLDTLQEFGQWLEGEGLQAIATRVSTGEECSIIIEDGQVAGRKEEAKKEWKAGVF